jgi:ABC-2 type transport system ATP-binding protein
MYVPEYLDYVAGLYLLDNRKARISEIIRQTGLQPEAHKKIEQLSKGYRQRVGLAQALIHDPEVLIMDEPTSGLDPNQIVGIRELICQLGKEKVVILSTHIMQEVEAMCNRTIIINKGKIVADAATTELTKAAYGGKHIIVEFNAAIGKSKITDINGVIHAERTNENTWAITTQGDEDVRKNIFNLAVREGIAVLSMNIKQHKLEDIFHQLTN